MASPSQTNTSSLSFITNQHPQVPKPVETPSTLACNRYQLHSHHQQRKVLMTNSIHRTLKRHHGKIRSRMKRTDKCVVCLEKASGMYFGAMVCLPCKSFFIRCTKDGKPQLTCLGDKSCSIDRTNRMRCQYCRYQKCLTAGMMRREKPESVEPGEGQELCHVCRDIANGIHFGVMTCEGCKKFFRRALKEAETYECKLQQICTLNPRNRNACRYCRYQKCIDVGMSRQAIRMGRPKKIKTEADTSYEYHQNGYSAANTLDGCYYNKFSPQTHNLYGSYKYDSDLGYGSPPHSSGQNVYHIPCHSPVQQQSPHMSYGMMMPTSPQSCNAPLSPGNDSGIESERGCSPIHSPQSFLPSPIKTEPVDIYDSNTGCTAGDGTNRGTTSQCCYQNKSDTDCVSIDVTNQKNFNIEIRPNQQVLSYDFKTGQNEFDTVVPSIATELDIDDMNDLLAALGQHFGNLGPQQNNKNMSNTTGSTISANEQCNYYNSPQIQDFTTQKIHGHFESNQMCKEQGFLPTTGHISQNSLNSYSSSSLRSVRSLTWPLPHKNFNGVYSNTRQPVFPMYVS